MIWWGRRSRRRSDDPQADAPACVAGGSNEDDPPILADLEFAPLPPCFIATRGQSLEQLLEAFRDIADRDDIHQAADRLILVLEWIRREAACAAADPIFEPVRLAS